MRNQKKDMLNSFIIKKSSSVEKFNAMRPELEKK